ncbi:amidohydrolase family protein [Sphingomonas sp. PB1R3]|uniref:amidohydrolase family protein n=1 Tax=Sphingomonas flavida TaxID=3096154 RepID=UPI002FC89A26
MIDAHHHLWALDTEGHQWPTAAEPSIHRDFAMRDLVAAAGDVDLVATVLVQSQPTDADTDWMLAVAADDPRIAAVVGWVDLASPDAPERIAALAAAPKLRGLRPMLQAIDDTDWLLDPALTPAIAAMQQHSLRFDALVQPRHLPMLARFMDRWPELPVVIDHAAKPFVLQGMLDPWRAEMAALAERGAWCKLSGLRTEQAPGAPAYQLWLYVDHLVACFDDRLMWGSDWPVLRLSGDDFRAWLSDADWLTGFRGLSRESLYRDAATQFYGLEG